MKKLVIVIIIGLGIWLSCDNASVGGISQQCGFCGVAED
jgi:hypothetical protein